MRRSRRLLLLGTAALGVVGVTAALPASAKGADATKASGPFGFTTQGLGTNPSYGEPAIAIAPDGRHVVVTTPGSDAKGDGTVQYWYSADDGRTWGHSVSTAPNGGGDSEVDFLPDGTLLSADLEISDSYIQRSTDFGRTWQAAGPAGTEQDRQWFAHTPDGKRAFLVYHDFAAEAEWISESTDGGRSWTTAPQDQIMVNSPDQLAAPGMAVTPKQGSSASLLDQGGNTFSGPMMVAPNGRDFYVVYSISNLESNSDPAVGVPPYGPVRGLVVAHSADAGKTWTNRYAVVATPNPSDPSKEETTGTFFPWGFIDQAGTVYVVYNSTKGAEGSDHFHQYYVYSKDKGEHWSKPVKLDGLPLGVGAAAYNAGAAVEPGVIDVAWYQTDNGTPSAGGTWNVWFAQITGADTGHPKVVRQKVTDIPNHTGGVCLQGILCGIGPGSSDRSLLDFFQLEVNPRTGLAEIAYADNHRLGVDKTTGTKIGEVVFAKQTRQPRR